MLFGRRKRLQELAEREASGETFWTTGFDESVRTKIWHAISDFTDGDANYALELARQLILRDDGKLFLVASGAIPATDMRKYLFGCHDEEFPTVVEACILAVAAVGESRYRWERGDEFADHVAAVLREHRVSYDVVNRQMVEFSSREMHVAVVAPTLTLLAGREDFNKAESAYLDALDEISKGKAADAITDAGTALQLTLVALGCSGNALGPLTKSAKSMGLLAPHDGPLLDAIEKVMHWVSADRSESGDAHDAPSSTVDDAWFIVHVVGALILRLVQGQGRGTVR